MGRKKKISKEPIPDSITSILSKKRKKYNRKVMDKTLRHKNNLSSQFTRIKQRFMIIYFKILIIRVINTFDFKIPEGQEGQVREENKKEAQRLLEDYQNQYIAEKGQENFTIDKLNDEQKKQFIQFMDMFSSFSLKQMEEYPIGILRAHNESRQLNMIKKWQEHIKADKIIKEQKQKPKKLQKNSKLSFCQSVCNITISRPIEPKQLYNEMLQEYNQSVMVYNGQFILPNSQSLLSSMQQQRSRNGIVNNEIGGSFEENQSTQNTYFNPYWDSFSNFKFNFNVKSFGFGALFTFIVGFSLRNLIAEECLNAAKFNGGKSTALRPSYFLPKTSLATANIAPPANVGYQEDVRLYSIEKCPMYKLLINSKEKISNITEYCLDIFKILTQVFLSFTILCYTIIAKRLECIKLIRNVSQFLRM